MGGHQERSYGGAVALYAITRLNDYDYEEEEVHRLVAPPGDYPHGLHTLCPAGEITLIDGKRWRTHPPVLFRKLLRKVTREPEIAISLGEALPL